MKKVITFFALSLAIVAKGQDVLQLNELEYFERQGVNVLVFRGANGARWCRPP